MSGLFGMIPGAVIGGLQARGQAKAQYEMQQAQWKKETLNGWLSIDQANYAAAQNMAAQQFNNKRTTTQAIKTAARSAVRTKRDMDGAYEDLALAFSTNRAATQARLSSNNNKGGSAEAVQRQIRQNAERSVQELALQEGLINEQIIEQRNATLEGSSRVDRRDAQFFVPGTQATDNSASAMISGAFSGAQQGLNFGLDVVTALGK